MKAENFCGSECVFFTEPSSLTSVTSTVLSVTLSIFAFVILKKGVEASEEFAHELRSHVARQIGAIARPKFLLFVPDLPKTRSGKIMRRLLRDIAEGRALGDTTTLADPSVVSSLKEQYEDQEG